MPTLVKLAGKGSDFVDSSTQERVELKTDHYDMGATSNFFIERWSDVDAGKPGSFWQAAEHGSTKLIYLYIKNSTCYIFDIQTVLPMLDELIKTLKPVEIKNTRWTTVGFKVPRNALIGYYTMEVLNEQSEKSTETA